jgi:hypothetical protein
MTEIFPGTCGVERKITKNAEKMFSSMIHDRFYFKLLTAKIQC